MANGEQLRQRGAGSQRESRKLGGGNKRWDEPLVLPGLGLETAAGICVNTTKSGERRGRVMSTIAVQVSSLTGTWPAQSTSDSQTPVLKDAWQRSCKANKHQIEKSTCAGCGPMKKRPIREGGEAFGAQTIGICAAKRTLLPIPGRLCALCFAAVSRIPPWPEICWGRDR